MVSHHVFTVPVVAVAGFATVEVTTSFKDYLLSHRPGGFASWEVLKPANTVSVAIQAAVAADEEAVVCAASDKYLEIAYDVIQILSDETPVGPIVPVGPVGPNPPSARPLAVNGDGNSNGNITQTGMAIVRFQCNRAVAKFAEQINDQLHRDNGKGKRDAAHRRMRQAYDAGCPDFTQLQHSLQ
ncbi:hypothetical protein BC628DRAFT_1420486 [Trametes gibbosa]|nr:hypothetical protein BC628DRAFT_1420486 [Trametes gibbosa]